MNRTIGILRAGVTYNVAEEPLSFLGVEKHTVHYGRFFISTTYHVNLLLLTVLAE